MARSLHYVLGGGDLRRDVRVIHYGKCEKSPYVENGLWFVHIPRTTETSVTFLVDREHARPVVMDDFDLDFSKWRSVAHKIIVGSDWNPIEECLWSEMPYGVHILNGGIPVRYGLSRYQSEAHPERSLWYIVLGLGDEQVVNWSTYEMFIVDQECTEPDFLNRIGNDPSKWMRICWAHPTGIEPWNAKPDQVPNI